MNSTECICLTGFSGPPGGPCGSCGANNYVDEATLDCVPCPANHVSDEGSVGADQCVCAPGFTGPTCEPCAVGTFKPERGNLSCTACPESSTTLDVATVRELDCVCAAGFTGENGTACEACAFGTFKAELGSAACDACPENSNTTDMASTAFQNCTCDAGYTGSLEEMSEDTCQACAVNTYKDERGAAACTACPHGSVAHAASVDIAACVCDLGYTGEGSGNCTACPSGTFKGTNGSAACTACGEMLVTELASTRATDCRCELGTEPEHVRVFETSYSSLSRSFNVQIRNDPDAPNIVSNGTMVRFVWPITQLLDDRELKFWIVGTNIENCKDGTFLSPLTVMVDELQEEQYSDVFIPSDIDFTSKICIYPGTEYTLNTKIRLKSLVPTDAAPTCRACPADTFKATSTNTQCSACAQHQQSPVRANASHLCTCNAGYTGPNGADQTCDTCSAGTFKPAPGPEDCTECPQGTFMDPGTLASLSEDACLSCPEGTTSAVGSGGGNASCVGRCPAGQVGNVHDNITADLGSLCTLCPVDHYKPSIGESECQACPRNAGTDGRLGQAFCQCKAGFAGPENPVNDTNCRKCAPGTYSTASNTRNCSLCSAGKHGVGLLLLIEEAAACQACPSGKFQPLLGVPSASNCTECPPGTYQPEAGAGPASLCIPCPAGTYQELSGQTEQRHCQFCDAGKYSNITGATSQDNCTACPAGTFLARATSFENLHQTVDDCHLCPAGKFGPRVGADSSSDCEDCPAGTFLNASGSISEDNCTKCPIGTYALDFRAVGETSPDVCVPCAAGKYAKPGAEPGALFEVIACEACGAGTYLEFTAATSVDNCSACPAGTFSGEVGADNISTCEACPAGFYSNASAATSSSTCVACPSGMFGNVSGASSQAQGCFKCAGGSFAPYTGSTSCEECGAGTFSLPGARGCTACPIGFISKLSGQASNASCVSCAPGERWENITHCVACEPGTYGAPENQRFRDSCQDCPAGTNSSAFGAVDVHACAECPAGSFSAPRSLTCTLCSAGKFSPVPRANSSATCQPCPADTYSGQIGAGAASACLSCPNQTRSHPESTSEAACLGICNTGETGAAGSCEPCAEGFYKNTTGSEPCQACPAFSQPTEHRDACTCDPGYFHASRARVFAEDTCTPCPAGSFSSERARVHSCTLCEPDTFSTHVAASEAATCLPCPSPNSAASPRNVYTESPEGSDHESKCTDPCPSGTTGRYGNCTACPPGQYKASAGSSPCLDCPSTTIAAPDATRCLCDAGHGFLGVGEAPRVRYVVTREGLDYVLNGTYAPVIAIYDGVGLEFDYLGLTNNDNGYRTVVTGRGISSTYEDNMLLVEVQPNQFAENLRYRSASNFALRLGVKWQLKREDELVEGYTRLLEPDMRAALRSKQHFTMDELDNLGLLSSEIRSTNYVRVGNRYYVPETRMGNSITHKIASEWPSRPVPTCAQCAPGLFKPSAGNEACEGCAAGQFLNETSHVCSPCPIGTFGPNANALGVDSCTFCPPGTFGNATGRVHAEQCEKCPAGFTGRLQNEDTVPSNRDIACAQCEAGKYSELPGLPDPTHCTECPAGTFSAAVAAESRDACVLCPAGSYSSQRGQTSVATCEPCPAGMHGNDVLGATSLDSGCQDCPHGTVQTELGAARSSNCSLCPAGTFSALLGFAGPSCEMCPAGKFSSDLGASSSAVCRACPVGTFSPTPGQSAEANCTQCPAGTYGVEEAQTSASMACVACLAGTYSAVPGAAGGAACEACPAGKYGTGEAQTSEAAGCALCPAGKYGSETGAPAAERCFNCPRGTYQPLTGRRKEASCLQCPEGSSQPNSGATSEDACIQCPAGKFAEGNLVTIDDCKACPANFFCLGARHLEACTTDAASPPGSTSADACLCNAGFTGSHAEGCASCEAGTYKMEAGSAACTECPADFFCASPVQVPEPCPVHSKAPSGTTSMAGCRCLKGFEATGNASQNTLACAECVNPGACQAPIPSSTVTLELETEATLTQAEIEEARSEYAVTLSKEVSEVVVDEVKTEVKVEVPVTDDAPFPLAVPKQVSGASEDGVVVEKVSLTLRSSTKLPPDTNANNLDLKIDNLRETAYRETCRTLQDLGLCACGQERPQGCEGKRVKVLSSAEYNPDSENVEVAMEIEPEANFDDAQQVSPQTFAPVNIGASIASAEDSRIKTVQTVDSWNEEKGGDLETLEQCDLVTSPPPCQATAPSRRRRRNLLQAGGVQVYFLVNATDPDYVVCMQEHVVDGETYLFASPPIEFPAPSFDVLLAQCVPLTEDVNDEQEAGQAKVPVQTWAPFTVDVEIEAAVSTAVVEEETQVQEKTNQVLQDAIRALDTGQTFATQISASQVQVQGVREVSFKVEGVEASVAEAQAAVLAATSTSLGQGVQVKNVVEVLVVNVQCPPGQTRVENTCVCEGGTRAVLGEAARCEQCPPGTFGVAAEPGICRTCPGQSYFCPGGTALTACPQNSVSAPGAKDVNDCHCQANLELVMDLPTQTWECRSCGERFKECQNPVRLVHITLEAAYPEDLTQAHEAAIEAVRAVVHDEAKLSKAYVPEVPPGGARVRARYLIPLKQTASFGFQVILPYMSQPDLDAKVAGIGAVEISEHTLHVDFAVQTTRVLGTSAVADAIRSNIEAQLQGRLQLACAACRDHDSLQLFGIQAARNASVSTTFHVHITYDLLYLKTVCGCFAQNAGSVPLFLREDRFDHTDMPVDLVAQAGTFAFEQRIALTAAQDHIFDYDAVFRTQIESFVHDSLRPQAANEDYAAHFSLDSREVALHLHVDDVQDDDVNTLLALEPGLAWERRPVPPAYGREILRAEKLLEALGDAQDAALTRQELDELRLSASDLTRDAYVARPSGDFFVLKRTPLVQELQATVFRDYTAIHVRERRETLPTVHVCAQGAQRIDGQCLCSLGQFCKHREISDLLEHSKRHFQDDNATCIEMMAQEYYAQVASLPPYAGKTAADFGCMPCPANSFCPGTGWRYECPDFAKSVTGSSEIGQCLCDAGRQWDSVDEACVPCPAGFFQRTAGTQRCAPCPANLYCGVGTVEPLSCPSNSWSNPRSQTREQCECVRGYEKLDQSCVPCTSAECTSPVSLRVFLEVPRMNIVRNNLEIANFEVSGGVKNIDANAEFVGMNATLELSVRATRDTGDGAKVRSFLDAIKAGSAQIAEFSRQRKINVSVADVEVIFTLGGVQTMDDAMNKRDNIKAIFGLSYGRRRRLLAESSSAVQVLVPLPSGTNTPAARWWEVQLEDPDLGVTEIFARATAVLHKEKSLFNLGDENKTLVQRLGGGVRSTFVANSIGLEVPSDAQSPLQIAQKLDAEGAGLKTQLKSVAGIPQAQEINFAAGLQSSTVVRATVTPVVAPAPPAPAPPSSVRKAVLSAPAPAPAPAPVSVSAPPTSTLSTERILTWAAVGTTGAAAVVIIIAVVVWCARKQARARYEAVPYY